MDLTVLTVFKSGYFWKSIKYYECVSNDPEHVEKCTYKDEKYVENLKRKRNVVKYYSIIQRKYHFHYLFQRKLYFYLAIYFVLHTDD